MTASVAMCTYNGALYIEEQLRSILAQTVPVNEIVICDDGSTDTTIDILHRVQQSTTTPITIYVNEQHLGVNANFEKAIKHCSGDIIFLSDQDDIWEENKVEVIKHYFSTHNDKTVVFGDAILIDSNGSTIRNERGIIKLWDVFGFSKKAQKQFDNGFELELWVRSNRATGATMALRKELGQNIASYDIGLQILHDCLLSVLAFDKHSLGYVVEPLIRYRLHGHNAAGVDFDLLDREYFDDARYPVAECWTNYAKLLTCTPHFIERIEFQTIRFNFIRSLFGWEILLSLLRYFRCYGIYGFSFFCFDYRRCFIYSISRIKRNIIKLFRTKLIK